MKMEKKKTDLFGLKYRPTLGANDNLDYLGGSLASIEFSECNASILKTYVTNDVKTILEIGVHRNPMENSSTGVFFENKNDNTIYIGVDINDKSYLDNQEKNIYTICGDSSNHQIIYDLMNELNIKTFDLIFIDGYHSVNQVYSDWKFIEKLSEHGVVIMHDTNYHPGPSTIFDAIDDDLFYKEKHCTTINDFGIAVIKKK